MSNKSEWGTNEWSPNNLNFITGCINDCIYCYAKEMSIRYKRSTPKSWKNEVVRENDLTKRIKKYDEIVMYPSTHDIRPEHLQENMQFLQNILNAGNDVLIVSKPHLVCIKEICRRFENFKDQILFRFTIGSTNDEVLKYWEPEAPDFQERLSCLQHAYDNGFETSVSCEPMLDDNIYEVVDKVSPYITETIWIGKINHLIGKTGKGRLDFNGHNNPETIEKAKELISWQSDEHIIKLYNTYKNNPMIKWKESIKKVMRKYGVEIDNNK
ncbi:MAG: radical SAM protein [Syntrophothermus sp.]